jgi:SAM-dependent methyltransferase
LYPAIVKGPTNLATKNFWEEDYYRGIEIPARPDPDFPYERCLAHALEELAPVVRGARVLEIGCSPARWLLWYAERFGAAVTGLEYSAAGVRLSRENLAAAGVDGEIHEADFFSGDLVLGRFDLVLSLGFIEHFDDVPAAFARHVDFVGDGGRIVIGMPNFRGLTGFLQAWGDRGYLNLHNRRAMDAELYRQLAGAHGMRLDVVRYIDGVDPAMIRATRRSVQVPLIPLMAWRRLRLSDHVNHRLISSYLLLTFTKLS